MSTFHKIECKTCKESFIPKSEINRFCSRRCFKKDFYHRKKAEEINQRRLPGFTCPSCGQCIVLPFDPVKCEDAWTSYDCPGCNTLMISVSESIVTSEACNGKEKRPMAR